MNKLPEGKPLLEPGYGNFQICRKHKLFARKDFYCTSLNEKETLLAQLRNRQKLTHENLISLDEVGHYTNLHVFANFEYFPIRMSEKIIEMSQDVKFFLQVIAQVLSVWRYLESKKLFLSNFEFGTMRFDPSSNKVKVIDRLERSFVDDPYSVDLKSVQTFLTRLNGATVSQRSGFSFALGLVSMATFFPLEEFQSVKESIKAFDFKTFSFFLQKFKTLFQVKIIEQAIGTDFFDSTIIPKAQTLKVPTLTEQNLSSIEESIVKHQLSNSIPSHFSSKVIPNHRITITCPSQMELHRSKSMSLRPDRVDFSFKKAEQILKPLPPIPRNADTLVFDELEEDISISHHSSRNQLHITSQSERSHSCQTLAKNEIPANKLVARTTSIEAQTESFVNPATRRDTARSDLTRDYLTNLRQFPTILLDMPQQKGDTMSSFEESTVQRVNFKSVDFNAIGA